MAVTAQALAELLQDPLRRFPLGEVRRQEGADYPGLYAWFVDEAGARDLGDGLGLAVRSGLMYAGQAGAGRGSATLASRLIRNHIGGNTYGSTLRLTLAAVLRAHLDLAPTDRRRMDPAGEPPLTDWMIDHLQLSIAAYADRGELDAVETNVLALLDPPFNLAKRPPTDLRRRLTALRRTFAGPGPIAPAGRLWTTRTKRLTIAPATGPTPEALAREFGLPNATGIRAFLRRRHPRPASEHGSRWGQLSPEMEAAVRQRFGGGEVDAQGLPLLRAVGLVAESYTNDTVEEQGTLTWTGSDWTVTGQAGWLLADFYAVLASATSIRPVYPSEGVVYLYAVWASMHTTYFGVRLFDANGTSLGREELLTELETLSQNAEP